MTRKTLFTGCGVALATPFKNGEVDYPALKKLLHFQLDAGTDAIIACGTTGEPATMTRDEWEKVLAFTVAEVAGRIPVIAGTGGNNTRDVIEKARRAKALGADGQLCVTPYYNKATQSGLIAHYTAIADDGALPMILYNVPSRTGLNLLPATVEKLAGHEMIVGVKEASGDMVQIMEILRRCGDRISLYSGSDELTAPILAMGGSGVISVAANILPSQMRQMAHGTIAEAAALNLQLLPLIRALFAEVNPIPVKAALHLMGICENELRLPLTPLSPEHESILRDEMKKVGLVC